MSVKVIDLYSGNAFDPAQIIADGYVGVIFKAGQGQTTDVPRLHPTWWQEAKDAGLLRGWYWVCDARVHSSNHVKEMDRINLFSDLGELGLWVDVEKPYISMTEDDYWNCAYAGHGNVIDFVYLLRNRGIKVGTYTGPGAFELVFRKSQLADRNYMAETELWTAQYPYNYTEGVSKPSLYGSWTNWVWWQYREGPDENIFNGDETAFADYLGGVVVTPPTTGGIAMKYTFTAQNIAPYTKLNLWSDHSAVSPSADVGDLLNGQVAEGDNLFPVYDASGKLIEQWLECKIANGVTKSPPVWVACIYGGTARGILKENTPPASGGDVIVDVTAAGVSAFHQSYPAGTKISISVE